MCYFVHAKFCRALYESPVFLKFCLPKITVRISFRSQKHFATNFIPKFGEENERNAKINPWSPLNKPPPPAIFCLLFKFHI